MTIHDVWTGAVKKFAHRTSLGLIGKQAWTFQELDEKMCILQGLLAREGIRSGDRVALWAQNQPLWGAVYLATTTANVVIVPILPDFLPGDTARVLVHSEAKILFVGKGLQDSFNEWKARHATDSELSSLASLKIITLEELESRLETSVEEEVDFSRPSDNDLAAIIYTSGTTGASKGVMLSHNNISTNVVSGAPLSKLVPGDAMVSVLPLAHTYECSLGFLLPLYCGSTVWYLGKPPAPAILMPALAKVRPQCMLTVPLFMEKVYRSKVLPGLRHGIIGKLSKVPVLGYLLLRIAGHKLKKTFGGRLKFFGIGGAPLAPDVARFLQKIRFNYAIGYGLTETSPLVAGSLKSPVYSTGPVLSGVQVKIAEPRNDQGAGEILVKGPNVMLGYYKDPVKTAEVLSPDGWFRTGDLGRFGEKGALFIKGRSKNLILGPSGENIYPEAIEAMINEEQGIMESLVLQRGQDIVAKVVLNAEQIQDQLMAWAQERGKDLANWSHDCGNEVSVWSSESRRLVEAYLGELKDRVNRHLARFSRISSLELETVPFEKTATLKIKRFLYS